EQRQRLRRGQGRLLAGVLLEPWERPAEELTRSALDSIQQIRLTDEFDRVHAQPDLALPQQLRGPSQDDVDAVSGRGRRAIVVGQDLDAHVQRSLDVNADQAE